MFTSKQRPIVIPQWEHQKLAGTLALLWGNAEFERPPVPFESFLTGVGLHDRAYGPFDNLPIGGIASTGIDIQNPEAMARFYGIPLEDYLAGQEWARENLARVRREAGLERDKGAETEEVPQPEEPQSGAPISSAPPAPVVPAQSLLSFTVRRIIGLFWPFIL
jgi:hypothetical protein